MYGLLHTGHSFLQYTSRKKLLKVCGVQQKNPPFCMPYRAATKAVTGHCVIRGKRATTETILVLNPEP
eukprot:292796-Chlamydomonas_euryale.AAC.3